MNPTQTQDSPGGWREVWKALTYRYTRLDLPTSMTTPDQSALEEVQQRVAEYQARLRIITMQESKDT